MTLRFSDSRILIVDDQAANIEFLERILSLEGYSSFRSTTDPREVLDLWNSFDPDLLLLDLMMPHVDGFDVMDQMRALGVLQEDRYVPILVLTVDTSREVKNRALSAGAKDFLIKPFDPDEVLLRISNLLETRSLYRALAGTNQNLEKEVAKRTLDLQTSLRDLEKAHRELQHSKEETIRRLSIAAELRDDDTGRHITRMSRYTGLLAFEIGLGSKRARHIELAAQMHDVGKIGIPDSILMKPGALTPEERSVMERHPLIGYDVLSGSSSELLQLAATIALTHHERIDGLGYPQGLVGENMPIEGRLTAIADVFDALTSDRVYRAALSTDESFEIMAKGRGTQFNPEFLDVFFENADQMLAARREIEAGGNSFVGST